MQQGGGVFDVTFSRVQVMDVEFIIEENVDCGNIIDRDTGLLQETKTHGRINSCNLNLRSFLLTSGQSYLKELTLAVNYFLSNECFKLSRSDSVKQHFAQLLSETPITNTRDVAIMSFLNLE